MANETNVVEGPHATHDWTVNNISGIEQYALCVGADPRTARAGVATDSAPIFAGVAMTEKEANDGQTNLGLTKEGFFTMTDAGSGCTMGAAVVISGIDKIRDAVAGDLLTGAVVGHTTETISADATGEVQLLGF